MIEHTRGSQVGGSATRAQGSDLVEAGSGGGFGLLRRDGGGIVRRGAAGARGIECVGPALLDRAPVGRPGLHARQVLAQPGMALADEPREGGKFQRKQHLHVGGAELRSGDVRDTTTPRAMAQTVARFVTGDVLKPASRNRLIEWTATTQTGLRRIRAGLPAGWRAGDKTGTSVGDNNATTDVAIAWPPGRAPIVIACFLSHSTVELDARNAAHAEVARIVAETWS